MRFHKAKDKDGVFPMIAIKIALIFAIGFVMAPERAKAQTPPPPNFDNFLDEDDFDGPPGTPVPPKRSGQNGGINKNAAPPAPDMELGSEVTGGAALHKFNGQKPSAKNKARKENPTLLEKKAADTGSRADKEINDQNYPDLIDSFDYPNADITDIVKAISELTGKNFILDPAVKGKVSIIAPSRISVAEAYKAFLSALAINNFAIVPSGKFLKIKPVQNAAHDGIETYSGAFAPNNDGLITRIVQLKYITARDVKSNLGSMLQSRAGDLQVYEPTNTLIISDYGSNIDRIMRIIGQLDVPGFEEQLEVIRVRYAKVSELAKTVDQIINKGKSNPNQGGGFNAGIPRFTPIGSPPNSSSDAFSLVIPDDRTNTLIVVGNAQGIEKVRKLVRKLDFRLRPEESGGVYVYYVKFNDAEKISQTLQSVVQASTASNTQAAPNPFNPISPAGSPIKASVFGGDVKFAADKTTNSLVVTASKQDWEVVKTILEKLDVARDQVYVEAIIMEINMSNLKQWGMNFYSFSNNSFAGRGGFVTDPSATSQFFNPANDKGGLIPFAGGGSVTVTPPGGTGPVQIPSLVGFINFLASVTNLNVLSTPQIMALDNEEAEIEVGDDVPVGVSNATANSTTTSSTTREKATIKLNIKPHISPGSNTMRLEITQSVKGISNKTINAKNLSDNAIALTTRNAKTNLIARDRDTIVLGGMMQDSETISETKIPLLGDIPILGWLFKGKKVQKDKNNLMIFLTPEIIRSSTASADLVKKKLKERLNFIEKNLGGKDTQGETIDQLRLEKNDAAGSM